MEKFQDWLLEFAEKVDGNQYLSAIKRAFITFLPFITAGSMASLLNTLICSTSVGLAYFIPELANISSAFTAINFATISIMSLPITFLVAMNLAKNDELPDKQAGVLALICYISVVPQTVAITVEGVTKTAAGLGTAPLGARGLFVGMLIAIFSEKIFKQFMKMEKIKIKMPDSVPPAIAQSFNILIPIAFTLLTVSVLGVIFQLVTGSYMNEWIYVVLQRPVEALFATPFGIIALMVVNAFFWFLGVHGGMVIFSLRSPVCAAALAANIDAVAAGEVPNQVFTNAFYTRFSAIGGVGCLFSLCLAILIASRREDHRTVAKLSVFPALFGIAEPVIFGIPMVLNMTLVIPYLLNTILASAIPLLATNIGFLACNTVDAPSAIPFFIGGFISYGWRGVVVQFIVIAITTVIYIPFVILANKLAVREKELAANK